MNAWQFDVLTRALFAAGSRRAILVAATGAGSFFLARFAPQAGAACGLVGSPCGDSSDCCGQAVCRNHQCRCKKGWKNCNQKGHCRHLATDPDHCGGCNQGCTTGCCRKGKCEESCGDDCCADCFAQADSVSGPPHPGTEFCCDASLICNSGTANPADDLCCWPYEVCLKGACCCDGCQGTKACGGKCCPAASCCNGKCCENGKVCARPHPNKPKQCVSANRSCEKDGDCFGNEQCWGGKCCSGDRRCFVLGQGSAPICCPVGEYCDQGNKKCCANGKTCSTSKKVRIRH